MSEIKSFRTYQPGSDPAGAFESAREEVRRILGSRAGDPDAWAGTVMFKHTFRVMTTTPRALSTAQGLARIWINREDRRFGGEYAGAIPIGDERTGEITGWLFVGWDRGV